MSDQSSTISTTMIEAGGLSFETDICGSSDKLALCLHGFPEHSISWRHQLPVLAELGYEAWAPNLRGYGNSSTPKGVDNYSIDKLTGDVAALIDVADKQEVVLLAHDWGGMIAWAFAIQKLRPLKKLIVMNLPHPGAAAHYAKTWEQRKKSFYILFFQLPWLPELLISRNHGRAAADAIVNTCNDPSRFPDDVRDIYAKNASRPGGANAMINYYRAMAKPAMRQLFDVNQPAIDLPTLMIWGEDDVALSKQLTLETKRYVNDLTLRYLPGVSHWVQQEAPEIVNAMLEAYLNDQNVPEAHEIDLSA